MGRAQCVLVVALFVELVHSWDVAIAAGDRIEFYTNDGNKTVTISFNSPNLTALAYDEVHNMLLYVDKQSDNDAICGYNITSVEYECYVQRSGRNIQGLAFDPVTELMFFTDTKERSINSFSFKSGSKNNANGNLVIKMDDGIPTDIAVDYCRGYIYWINTNLTTSSIERARLDGSDREVVINATYNMDLHSLAIGQQTHKMYWVEPETPLKSSVYSADSNGKNWVFLVEYTILSNGEPSYSHPNALTVSKNNLYMTGWCATCGRQRVWKIDTEIRTDDYEPLLTISTNGTVGIAANNKMKDQGISDCIPVPNTECEGLFCTQYGNNVNGQSLCKCTPENTGMQYEVPLCDYYCLHGKCSFSKEGLPECRCDAGYSGTRCEVYACHQYCANGGACSLNEEGKPVCSCMANYEGNRCDSPKDICQLNLKY